MDKSASFPNIKTSIEFKLGFEDKTAHFEIFKDLPIKAGFSWGKKSGNMSYKWLGKSDSPENIYKNITSFLESINIKYPKIIHALGVFQGPQEQLQKVDSAFLENQDETDLKANFIYTTDPEVAIAIRPADCNISVVFAKTYTGKNLVGMIHSSAIATNAGIPRLSINHLIENEKVDPKSIRIGIAPGISTEHFVLPEESIVEKVSYPISENNWKENISSTHSNKNRHVNILGATIMQFIEAGVELSQIEAYQVDTYFAMRKGEGFSHRLYEEYTKKGKEIDPGRFMVAVQLID